VKFGFGVITCQRHPADSRTEGEVYRDGLELAVEAERLGFDSTWVSEHHFVDDGYLPSSMVMAGAIAAATQKVEIGTGVLLAPFHDPLRLAEDTATVDLLSAGRLVLGLGQGWRREEFDGFGVAQEDGSKRLREAIRVMREGWSDGTVEGTGVSITPKPGRPGGPPIWLGGFKEKAIRRAARIADGFIAPRAAPQIFAEQVGWLKDELERRQRDPSTFRLALLAPVFAWEDGPAWPVIRDHQHFVTWKYDDIRDAHGRTGALPILPPFDPAAEERLRSMVIAGTPDEVAAALAEYEVLAGGEVEIIARLYWPGMDPAMQREAMRVFAERVMPQLRD
jgi:alkanesulfonate monooxygenase SsuD/methylene tetrahydromethanopterin reductase-like flavin-dependent oxidoreductase (luciferase family)